MHIDTDEEMLRALADGKPMDYEQWPDLYSRLIPRLEKIVHGGFASQIPSKIPSSQPHSSPPRPELATGSSSSQSSTQSTNKENAPPHSTPSHFVSPLPKEINALLISITTTLDAYFTKYPPHTIQRVAELLLYPNQHYRKLSSYLHALDRVVHVTSGDNTFPLPPAIPDPSSLSVLSNGSSSVDPSSITWGRPATTLQAGLGSDESLGGALLTPIPWLTKGDGDSLSPLAGEVKTESTDIIEGPNGPGGVETVSISMNGVSSPTTRETDGLAGSLRTESGVTQGELVRQEQEAGVVTVTQLARESANSDGLGEEDEVPHARGPAEIGIEDTGPQALGGFGTGKISEGMQEIDIKAAMGRKLSSVPQEEAGEKSADVEEEPIREKEATPKREADEEMGGTEKRLKSEEAVEVGLELEGKDDEGMALVDADGSRTEEPKMEIEEEKDKDKDTDISMESTV